MTFQQFGAMKCARVFGGLTALTLLLTVSACDQADPFAPASAQSSQVIGPNGAGPDGMAQYDSNLGDLGDAGLSNATFNTTESGIHATAFGMYTVASGDYSTALGQSSEASGVAALAAGRGTVASGAYSVAMGRDNTATQSYAFAMGYKVDAGGMYSTAMGYKAATAHKGSFVFGDGSAINNVLTTTAENQFRVRAIGGTTFFSNRAHTTGVTLAPGAGAWSALSDATMKENYRNLDGETVLEKLAGMNIQEWNYISQDAEIRHVGPTAQDFYAAFGLGEDEKRISTIDADGIALVAIQALERRNSELRETVERHEQELDRLNQRLERLERALLDR